MMKDPLMKDDSAAYWQSLEDFFGRPVVLEPQSWNDVQPSLGSLLSSWVWRSRFDHELAVGVRAAPGTALWLHSRRITSSAERDALAGALRRSVQDARCGPASHRSTRIDVDGPNVLCAESLIDAVTMRLVSSRPVEARGMARLRLLLGDGRGPLYRFGRGDLGGRLGAAMAAL